MRSFGSLRSSEARRMRTACFTTDEILVKASQKKSCASRAQSVDMESFEIVKAASAWGARGVVIRAISDAATEDLPINFNLTLSEKKEVSLSKVLMQLAKNPLALPSLIRFGKQSQRAGALLAAFLENYLQDLAGRKDAKSMTEAAAGGAGRSRGGRRWGAWV